MRDAALRPLRRELDRLSGAGRSVDLWWRDDDAVRDTPALGRLLRLSLAARAPLALAVIPAPIEPSLVRRLAERPDVSILVHGHRHADHAPSGEKPAEFGPHRPLGDLVRDAGEGLRTTLAAFGAATLPVLVPPWNRAAPGLLPALPRLGYRAVSTFGRPGRSLAAPGLIRIDTHLDPVDWRGSRSLRAPEQLAAAFRAAADGPDGPVGLLTHHLAFDEALWGFCEEWLGLVSSHPAVRLRSLVDAMGAEPRAPHRHSHRRFIRTGSAPVETAPS